MIDTNSLNSYCAQMEEIKRRIEVVDFFISGRGHALFEPTTLESSYLQLRKVLELIAMASLVANKKILEKTYKDISGMWNAELMLKDIGRVNPDFYPRPVVESTSPINGVVADLQDRTMNYLTKDEFVRLYKRCGSLMHADNPLGKKANLAAYKKQLPEWRNKIVNLLNTHIVKLPNDQNFYLIHMREARDGKSHGYLFAPHEQNGG